MTPAAAMRMVAPQLRLSPGASRVRCASAAFLFGLLTVAACSITTVISLSLNTTGDYATHGIGGGDNAGPPITALLHGDFGGYVAHQPAIGLTSLVLRVPFAGLAALIGDGNALTYRFGAAACLLSLALFAVWLIAHRRADGVGWLPGLAAAALLLVSPAVQAAVEWGHPEDVLAGVLATGAVIAATRGHSRWAAVLLGLAVGAKPWAVIAVPPVLIGIPDHRARTAAIAGGLTALLTVTAPLADPAAFLRAIHAEGTTHLIDSASLWWPLSSPLHLPSGALSQAAWLPLGISRSVASLIGLAAALPLLAVAWTRARRRGCACDALALLALIGVTRCAIDPTNVQYYYLAALIPLAAWESVALGRPPLIAGLASVAVALMPEAEMHIAPWLVSGVSILGTLVLARYLASYAFSSVPPHHCSRLALSSRRQT